MSPLDYLGKGTFFLWTIFSGPGQNMVRVQKWTPFFGPKISVFGPKIRFLPYDPNFAQWPIFSPPWKQFFDFPSGVTAVSVKKFSWPVKKSSPFPLWGHRLPVTALALSARGLDKRIELYLQEQGYVWDVMKWSWYNGWQWASSIPTLILTSTGAEAVWDASIFLYVIKICNFMCRYENFHLVFFFWIKLIWQYRVCWYLSNLDFFQNKYSCKALVSSE